MSLLGEVIPSPFLIKDFIIIDLAMSNAKNLITVHAHPNPFSF